MAKKVPISFNESDYQSVKELIDLLGISDVYGDFPKAVKFGINLAISAIQNPEKVYTALNDSELALYFQSVARYQIKRKKRENDEKMPEFRIKV